MIGPLTGAPPLLGSQVTVISDGNYNAFAGVTRRSDGKLVACWYKGSNASGELTASADIYTSVSTDSAGSGWGTPALAVSESDACRDPNLARLSDGRLALTYTVSDDSTYWHPYVRFSSDDGATWGSAVAITHGFSNSAQAFVSAPLVELGNGDLLAAMYGDWGSPAVNSVSRLSKSTDGGATWSALSVIASGGSRDWEEPNVVLLDNGTLLAFLRSDNPSTKKIYMASSTDSGATWGSPTYLFDGSGEPSCYQNQDGRVFVNYRDPSNYPRYAVSRDHGATWSTGQDYTGGQTSLMAYGQFVRLSSNGSGVAWAVETASAPSAAASVYWQRFDDAP